jgi:hypothetical protein
MEQMRILDEFYSTILDTIKQLTIENRKMIELKNQYLKKFFG